MTTQSNPNGVLSPSPGLVADGDLPWVGKKEASATPTGLHLPVRHADATPLGLMLVFGMVSQGSPPAARNPGLGDRTPMGFDADPTHSSIGPIMGETKNVAR